MCLNFQQNLSAFIRGWQLVAVGVPVQSRPPLRAWTTQLSASNRCHQIQKGHVTPTATSCHLLMKAERFCRKFGNFFHHNLTLCAECFIRNYVSRVHKHSLPNLILCLDFSKQSENCDWLKIWLGSKLWLCTLRTPIQLRLWFIYAHLGRVPTDMMT